MHNTIQLMDRDQMNRSLERLACQVLEENLRHLDLALVGIQRRGVHLAKRIQNLLQGRLGEEVPLGKLDINLYRDDWTRIKSQPRINSTDIAFSVDGRNILLVDDVIFTGRTTRAGLEAVLDFGRPERVELLTLIDRGHRELPIHPDYTGKRVHTARHEQVDVLVQEQDGRDEVLLTSQE
ncbi:MAG: bifunctional pyr operon transcriptional regulator/uracil phosphoribosyltransferase PyrR [Desulfohalobiaceae bacterium]|nr:bifunctional pyr operon transcriptional regulator/uracil phosphoribosyltransferase PyrR [Desulfohalobiaceae bacterium]